MAEPEEQAPKTRMGEPDRAERSESHVIAERREKLERLRGGGVEPFPHAFPDRAGLAL